ncbi:MAG: hypothetical protein CVU84_14665 [Firmicutes bacterium HGW-Firmicutes-1]|jgi:muramoyltetrapeptide carboxypeptidase LdcA involved in peptidoglycan recycling|nr:MAG: hypothetical protein CVU84_14665 [Firmicutes bacterium HGW-Firmicutes-1]
MNKRIRKGDTVYVCAPSNSMSDISDEMIKIGVERFNTLGYNVKIGKNANKEGVMGIASLEDRLEDFEAAFNDERISLIMPIFGGYNSNELLKHLDYGKINRSGKTIIGYSDITALLNAINMKTGNKMLHGISFSSFCDPNIFDEVVNIFLKIIEGEKNIILESPEYCAEDLWFLKKKYGPREKYKNTGWRIVKEGEAEGELVGGNIDTLLTLLGTEFFPNMDNKILLIEAEFNQNPKKFMQMLTQLMQMGCLSIIKGLVVGAFSRTNLLYEPNVLDEMLIRYTKGYNYPIISNTHFSHIDPIYTIPIGGRVHIDCIEKPSICIKDSLYD